MFSKINKIILSLVFFIIYTSVNAGVIPNTKQDNLSLSTSSPSIIVNGGNDCGGGSNAGSSPYNIHKYDGDNRTGDCTGRNAGDCSNNSGYCTATSYSSSAVVFKSMYSEFENSGYRILDPWRGWYCFNQAIHTTPNNWRYDCKSSGSAGCSSSTSTSCSLSNGERALIDDTDPIISVTTGSNVFDGDQDHWCNMNKYLASNYGTDANPTLPGCEYYKGLNSVVLSCGIRPSYSNASFIDGTATTNNQSWQNSNSGNPCYYSCTNGYTGNDCGTAPAATGLSFAEACVVSERPSFLNSSDLSTDTGRVSATNGIWSVKISCDTNLGGGINCTNGFSNGTTISCDSGIGNGCDNVSVEIINGTSSNPGIKVCGGAENRCYTRYPYSDNSLACNTPEGGTDIILGSLTCGVKIYDIGIDIQEADVSKFHNGWNLGGNGGTASRIAAANRFCGAGCTSGMSDCTGTFAGLGYTGGGSYLPGTNQVKCVGGSDINSSGILKTVPYYLNRYDFTATDAFCASSCQIDNYENGLAVERTTNILNCSCWDSCDAVESSTYNMWCRQLDDGTSEFTELIPGAIETTGGGCWYAGDGAFYQPGESLRDGPSTITCHSKSTGFTSSDETLLCPPAPNSCASPAPGGNGINLSLYEGTPGGPNEAWLKQSGIDYDCVYSCINGYTGNSCEIPPAFSCESEPNYPNAIFNNGTPTSFNQAWVKGTSGGCYYTCNAGWGGNNCNAVITFPDFNAIASSDGYIHIRSLNIGAHDTCSYYSESGDFEESGIWGNAATEKFGSCSAGQDCITCSVVQEGGSWVIYNGDEGDGIAHRCTVMCEN